MVRGSHFRVSGLISVALIFSLLQSVALITTSSATDVSTTIASVYIDAPMVQGSYARHHGGQTEDFNTRNTGSNNLGVNTSILGGTITSGSFSVLDAQTWGGSSSTSETATAGGTGSRFAQAPQSGVTITFANPVKYVGFHWSAGNSGNTVSFNSAGVSLASLTSTRITEILGSALSAADFPAGSSAVTASSGATYKKKYYFGNPREHSTTTPETKPTMGSADEPFAYVHAYAQNDESFDSITFSGTGFELDNITISSQDVPIRNSLVLTQEATTSLTLGESAWNFKGVTTTDSSTISTGWVSDSSTVVSSTRISIEQDLSISSGTITMGRTALFRTAITNSADNTCGTTFTLVDSYTATDTGFRDLTLADNGTPDRDRLIRGFCYKWTIDPSSNLGSGAIRPTSSASGTRFNSNLESPMIIIPEAAVDSCAGAGSLVNGDFEVLPAGLQTQSATSSGDPSAVGIWHGYAANANPKQILWLLAADDLSASTFKLNGWRTTASDGYIEIQRAVDGAVRSDDSQNFDAFGVRPASGNFHAELAARELSSLFQDISTIPGTTIRWSIKHRARNPLSAGDSMEVRIGSTSSQTPQTVLERRSPTNNVYLAPTYSATSDAGFTQNSVITTTLANGWREYRGAYTVPSGQSTTRFAFTATVGSSGVGNLLDDIQFSPLIACPATLTVVAGREVTINPFDIDASGNPLGTDAIDSYGWSDAFVTEELTASAGTVSRTGAANRSIRYVPPSTVGTQTINFQITNPQGDRSSSRYTVNVVADSRTRAPGDIPMDPRTTSFNLRYPQVTTATTQVLACVRQANSAGEVITGGSLRFDLGTRGTAQSTIDFGSESVTVINDLSNYVRVSGPLSAVNRALSGLWVTRSDSPARLSSQFYIQVSSIVSGLVLFNPTTCADSISNQIRVTNLRPIKLTQTRRYVVPLKNGRQSG